MFKSLKNLGTKIKVKETRKWFLGLGVNSVKIRFSSLETLLRHY